MSEDFLVPVRLERFSDDEALVLLEIVAYQVQRAAEIRGRCPWAGEAA